MGLCSVHKDILVKFKEKSQLWQSISHKQDRVAPPLFHHSKSCIEKYLKIHDGGATMPCAQIIDIKTSFCTIFDDLALCMWVFEY